MEIFSEVKKIIRKTLVENSTISSLVGARVHPSHIRSIEKPVYPCICISFEAAGRILYNIKELRGKSIEIVAYSQISHEEANRISERVIELLHKARLSASDVVVILSAETPPNDAYLETDRLFISPVSYYLNIVKLNS